MKRGALKQVLVSLGIILVLVMLTLAGMNALQQERSRDNLSHAETVHRLALPAGNGGQNSSLESGTIYFVGNATVIIRYAGFTILTDPNFLHKGDHVHLGYGLQAKRLTNPAIELDELPPIDLVILSHMHDDHFDKLVQRKLNKNVLVVTTNHAAKALRSLGFKLPLGLDTWHSTVITKGDNRLTVTAMPGQHGPGLVSGILPPVNGNMLSFQNREGKTQYRIYISGDTLIHDNLRDIPRQFPNVDMALLHLGGTRVMGIFVTMDAKQGVRMLELIAPREAIPIHYNDYDRFDSPIEDFQQAVDKAGLTDKVRYLKHGETYTFHSRLNQPGE